MIDWVTAIIPFEHQPLNSGSVLKVLPDGEIDWEAPCRLQVEGSHEETISVRSHGGSGEGQATELVISGNPAKYLQGHNVFGSDDLLSLVYDTFHSVCSALALEVPAAVVSDVAAGNYRLNRVDVNYMFALGTLSDVKSWLRAAEYKSKTRHGRPASKSGTLYWGKHSRRWSMKAYSKGEEIRGPKSHRLPRRFSSTPIEEFAQDKLRVELTLRTKELEKIGLMKARNWNQTKPREAFSDYLERIDMSEQVALSTEKLLELPHRLKGTYILWKSGENPRENMCRQTFYRHRRELLEYGIDINLAVEKPDRSNVVPLIRVLEAKPVEIPDWAFDQGLVHSSTRQAANVA